MSTTHQFRLRPARPRWRGTLGRSLYAGVVVGALCGFVTLVLAIVAALGAAFWMRGEALDIRIVYREIAPMAAGGMGVLAFAGNLAWERTHPAPRSARERTR